MVFHSLQYLFKMWCLQFLLKCNYSPSRLTFIDKLSWHGIFFMFITFPLIELCYGITKTSQ